MPALHLMATQPDLGITNPYQLTQEQFDAAIALLEEQFTTIRCSGTASRSATRSPLSRPATS